MRPNRGRIRSWLAERRDWKKLIILLLIVAAVFSLRRSYLLFSELVFIPMNAVLVLGAFAIYRFMILGGIDWTLLGITAGGGVLALILG